MKQRDARSRSHWKLFITVSAAIIGCTQLSLGQSPPPQQAPPASSQVMTTTTPSDLTAEPAPKIPPDQLDSLVAPIALYPDPLLAQTLAASTYPLEIIQLQQWMERNKNLKDKSLADAVAKQPWDPSVQSLASTPDLMQRMAGNIQWTTDLGNAFLANQQDVMDAVQRMRMKAQGKGTLKTSSQQVVETRPAEGGKQVVVIEPANPEVVYVPSYDPAVVYGPPAYPYYPYSYPGWYAGMGLAFGAGLAWGSYWGGHWGDCDWGHGDVNINNKNNFNRNNINNINRGNRPSQQPGRGQAGQGNRWQHNPSHRGNAPYGDRNTSNRFGQGNRGQGANRPGGGAGRPGGGAGASQLPAGGRGGAGAGNRPSTRPSGGSRPGGGSAASRPSTRPSGGANKVGNRTASSRPSTSRGGGFSGGSGNYARASSNRGGRSMGGGGYSRGGGGFSRGGGGGGFSRGGGGGRGGGGRGGGGRRR